MRHWLHSNTILLIRRIALLYAVLMLCRIVFLAYNREAIGMIGGNELWSLFEGALKFDTVSVIYANMLFVVLSLAPFHIRETMWYGKAMFWYYIVVNSVLLVAVNMADAVYFRYTQKRFTADEIFFADNSNSAHLAMKFAAENWYLVLFSLCMIALLVWGYGRKIKPVSPLRKGAVYYAGNTVILAVAGLLCIAGIRGGVTRMTRPITLSNATLYTSESSKANLILSNPFCIIRTIGSSGSVKYEKYFSREAADGYFTPIHRPDSSAVNLAGHNVVIFIMESMSAEHSAYLSPDLYTTQEDGYTPFLDSLMRSGLTFRRMYANGTRSIQAMPAILGSIPSFKQPFVLMPQSLGKSRQLPAILNDAGYATSFFCGSEYGSMGFGAYARSAGVETLVSREEYERKHGSDDFDGYWGIWDEPFLQFAGEEFATTQEPFFAALFTLSAHHPFLVPEKYTGKFPEGRTEIHKCVAYDDNAFRLFFERFGNEEWFRRTIFVFVADHVSSEKFAGKTMTFPDNHHIIGFIYTPEAAIEGQIGEVVQQIDIMPTLLGLLGNREPYFAFGRDVLNEPYRPKWVVMYDSEFKAVTDSITISLDQHNVISATHIDRTKITDTTAMRQTDTTAMRLKALLQQYYTRIEQKDYTAGR